MSNMRHGFKLSLLYFFKILLIFLCVAFVFKRTDSRISSTDMLSM